MPCYSIAQREKMKYSVLFIAVLLLATAFIAGCTQQAPAQPKEVKIGAIVSMTGPNSNVGKSMWQSAVLATDEINANGGVFVKQYNAKIPIKLVQGDDESTRDGGQKAATKLITEDKVDILVGGYASGVTSAYQQTVAE
jgi:branched-chain amino acid transport system substrate-binding protein